MQRYKNISEVKVGHRIMFDNTAGYFNDFARMKYVGEVDKVNEENIEVKFKISSSEFIIRKIPYFLAQ